MNLARIIRATSCYLFLTGYQIRWYDHKELRYRLTVSGVLYFLLLFLIYLICFCHHFESSVMMKVLSDISPFLKDLARLQVLIGLSAYLYCLIEAKNLIKLSNGLINIFTETIKRLDAFDISEVCIYLLFFTTLSVAFTVGLYIAIELEFKLPTLDQIMIGMALFIPHFTLAGCLRLYTLGLWLIKQELVTNRTYLQQQEFVSNCEMLQCIVEVENVNPVVNTNSVVDALRKICEKISKRVDIITEYWNVFDGILQRQLAVLMGMNFTCLLAGTYAHVYFENTWKILFANRDRRVFYAANGAIFVCILVDYGILLFTRWSFCQAKQKLYNLIAALIYGNKPIDQKIKNILEHIMHKLSKELKLKLFGLVEFNGWNFLLFQGLMISIIALIVSHQYLNDQIKELNERFDVNDSE